MVESYSCIVVIKKTVYVVYRSFIAAYSVHLFW